MKNAKRKISWHTAANHIVRWTVTKNQPLLQQNVNQPIVRANLLVKAVIAVKAVIIARVVINMANDKGEFYRPMDIYGTPDTKPEKSANGPKVSEVPPAKATLAAKSIPNPTKGPKPSKGVNGNRISTPNRKPRKLRGTGY
jgi:hypothetical protein